MILQSLLMCVCMFLCCHLLSYTVSNQYHFLHSLYCSSIGLAKAALESINGENLFGNQGASWSVIYVDIDAHNRNRTIFDTILPRESNSKVSINLMLCILSELALVSLDLILAVLKIFVSIEWNKSMYL